MRNVLYGPTGVTVTRAVASLLRAETLRFQFCAHVDADRGHVVADRTIRIVREGRNAPRLPF